MLRSCLRRITQKPICCIQSEHSNNQNFCHRGQYSFRDLDKLILVKFGYENLILGMKQLLLLTYLPQNMMLISKVVKSDTKIIILFCQSESVTLSLKYVTEVYNKTAGLSPPQGNGIEFVLVRMCCALKAHLFRVCKKILQYLSQNCAIFPVNILLCQDYSNTTRPGGGFSQTAQIPG